MISLRYRTTTSVGVMGQSFLKVGTISFFKSALMSNFMFSPVLTEEQIVILQSLNYGPYEINVRLLPDIIAVSVITDNHDLSRRVFSEFVDRVRLQFNAKVIK